jgi:hypothetical protein
MEEEIIIIYCVCDDWLKALGIADDPQARMSHAEVMTVALVAARYYGGNLEQSRKFLAEQGYIPNMLGKSRYNRRLRAIPENVWQALLDLLATIFKFTNEGQEYCLDSFPVPVCDNIRIRRCRLYQEEDYRGYLPSKRRYFYGLRVHLVVTKTGEPVEFVLAPGAWQDCRVLKQLNLDLPEGATLYGDKAYNDYEYEDLLEEAAGIRLRPIRKKNSVRALPACVEFIQQKARKRIETTISQITSLFPKKIHAVTPRGFELKVSLFILAFAFRCL